MSDEPAKIQTFKFGGGDETKLTALEAAQRFTETYFSKDLTSTRVQVPKEKIDYGLSTEVVADMSEGEWKAKAKEINDEKEREAFKKYWSQYEGGASELLVWRYISRIPESIPLALFHNFDLRMFRLFTGKVCYNYFMFHILMDDQRYG
jgi:hypothetical protein